MPATVHDKSPLRRQPASAKAQQRVRDILRVGREILAEQGFERTSTTGIARRLGISEATVFSYFSGKRELCAHVISDWYDEIIAAVETGLPREEGVKQQFAYIVRAHLRLFLLNGSGMCALVLSEGRTKGHEFGGVLSGLQRRYTSPLMAVLALGQERGEVRTDVPLRLLRSMVFGPMEHVLWEATLAEHPFDIESTTAQLVDLLWGTLQPPDTELAALRQFRAEITDAGRRLAQSPAHAPLQR
jgi:AcrR family transcriptional regulator